MKKKILTIALALSMLTACTAVFADTNDTENTDPVVTSENTPAEAISSYIKSDFTIESVETDDDMVTLVGKDAAGEPVNAVVFENTLVFDNTGAEVEKLEAGMQVSVYTNANAPMTLQLPVTYRPDAVIVQTDKQGFVDVDVYNEEGVNSANTLSTDKINEKGSFVVFYTNSTRSIPAVVNPSKVVKIEVEYGAVTDPSDAENVDDNGDIYLVEDKNNVSGWSDVNSVVINGEKSLDINSVFFNGSFMLPVREICENLGYEVAWDSELSAVTVGTIQMGVNFNIGVNSYNKARMMPQELSSAPIIISSDERGGLTYVPVEFFSEILGVEVLKDGSTLNIVNGGS